MMYAVDTLGPICRPCTMAPLSLAPHMELLFVGLGPAPTPMLLACLQSLRSPTPHTTASPVPVLATLSSAVAIRMVENTVVNLMVLRFAQKGGTFTGTEFGVLKEHKANEGCLREFLREEGVA